MRVEGDKTVTRTIGELIQISVSRSHDIDVTPTLAQATIGRNGIKADGDLIYVANNATAIAAILRDTPWVTCWATVLARLPGATRAGVTRFKGMAGTCRAVTLPLEA
jgi:hypothetical protein